MNSRMFKGTVSRFMAASSCFSYTWASSLYSTPELDSSDMFRGVIQSLVYAAVFTALGFRHFARRDVTS